MGRNWTYGCSEKKVEECFRQKSIWIEKADLVSKTLLNQQCFCSKLPLDQYMFFSDKITDGSGNFHYQFSFSSAFDHI